MIGYLLVGVTLVLLTVILANPKIGAVLVWPVVFLYPHLYMQKLHLLPWGIGIDDLFICLFFLIVVVRRNFLGRIPVRMGLAGKGACIYLAIWTVANFSGWSIMPELLPIQILKEIFKCVIFVLFTYCMLHTIDTGRELRRVTYVFVIVLTLAGLTAILHQLMPQHFIIFTSAKLEAQWRVRGEVTRAMGSLVNHNMGSVLLGMAILFIVCLLRSQPVGLGKLVLFACMPILLAAIVMMQSRTGVFSLGIALATMALVGRQKRYAWLLLCGGLLMVFVKPGLFLGIWDRIQNAIVWGQWSGGAAGRTHAWIKYYETATAQVVVFGQGFNVGVYRVGMHAHNVLISALFVHGICGLIWLFVFFGKMARRSWWVVRNAGEPYRTVASGVLWGLLAWCVGGLTLDSLYDPNSRYVYFFFAVLVERGYALAREAPLPSGQVHTGHDEPMRGRAFAGSAAYQPLIARAR